MTVHACARALERHGIAITSAERADVARWLATGDPRVVVIKVWSTASALVAIWLRRRWLPAVVTSDLAVVTVLPARVLRRQRASLERYRLRYNLDVQRAAG